MIAVIQRVSEAAVSINGDIYASIGRGYLILLGVEHSDNEDDVDWLVRKIVNMRIFQDKDEKMNLSLTDVQGALLVVSQFTLHASIKKGNRPSFIEAASAEVAIPLYESFIVKSQKLVSNVQSGVFGADMKVSLVNDGPVTILVDTKNKR